MSVPVAELSYNTWTPGPEAPAFSASGYLDAAARIRESVHLIKDQSGRMGLAFGGQVGPHPAPYRLVGSLPPLYPEWLGDQTFAQAHGVRFPYIAGEMANGIATSALVIAAARAGVIGFFGAAGLMPDRIEKAIDEIQAALGRDGAPYGSNLIHSPQEPQLEEKAVQLYLQRGVRRVCASAFMSLSPHVVWYACKGLRTDPQGRIVRENHVFAKVSRPEVARPFMEPAPPDILTALVEQGRLTPEEAALAARVPLAEDVTVESDSGGHTDNRPLTAIFPVLVGLRDEMMRLHGYDRPIRVGAAGGLGTPSAVAAAFGLGAAYVLTGSVNQASVESGLSRSGKQALAAAGVADVVMAPAADMFELGVKVQILKRGTMFAMRASKLYEFYTTHPSLESIPPEERTRLEKDVFQLPLDEVWENTRKFFDERDPREVAKAEADPRHRMALVFRWYLGLSSKWAILGTPERKLDYQIWCGPAMGAFNNWVAGSFLEDLDHRSVGQIALNLLEGAAVITRAQQLRACGVAVPEAAFQFIPRFLS